MLHRFRLPKIVIATVLIMSSLISGCKGQESVLAPPEFKPVGQHTASVTESGANNTAPLANSISKEYVSLADADVEPMDFSAIGENIVIVGKSSQDEIVFYSFDIYSYETKRLNLVFKENIQDFSIKEDGTVCLLTIDENAQYGIHSIRQSGETEYILIDPEVTLKNGIYEFEAMEEGFLVDNYEEVLALDCDGKIVKSYGKYSYGSQILRLSAENTLIIFPSSAGREPENGISSPSRVIQVAGNLEETARYEIAENYSWFIAGIGEKLYAKQGTLLYAYDLSTGDTSLMYDTASGNTYFSRVWGIGDEKFFSMESIEPEVLTIAYSAEKVVMELATYNVSYQLMEAVHHFNEFSSDYMISLKDYAQYDTYDSANGLNRFATEIISGNTPDIYDLSFLTTEQYATQGLLEDLSPYLATMSEAIFPAIMENSRYNGKIYEIIPAFTALALSGGEDTFAGPLTVDGFLTLAEEYSPEELLGPDLTRGEFMEYMMIFMGRDLLSKDKGKCNFTSESFISMLEYASQLPESKETSLESEFLRAYNGEQQLIVRGYSNSLVNMIAFNNTVFGGKAQFSGFPSEKGCGASLSPQMRVGMSASSQHKEGVWSFFEFLLSEKEQQTFFARMFLPANSKVLEYVVDKEIGEYFSYPENYLRTSTGDGISVEIPGTLDEKTAKAQAYEVLNSIDSIAVYETVVYNTIMECCAPFFAGDRSAQETAKIIQSRVGIYMAEQYG